MQEGRKISVCYTTYNRVEQLLDSMENIYDDARINEIIVSDDHSFSEYYEMLQKYFEYMSKVKLFRNDVNLDCYKNKRQAVELATNEWVCLWDSDNVFGTDYLDTIFSLEWDAKTIYTPCFAKPAFDFRPYENLLLSKENIAEYIDKPLLEVSLNACNYFVNRSEYLRVFDDSVDPVTSDTIFHSFNWLNAGNKIKIVAGLEYFHTIHPGSHYQNNVLRTPQGFHDKILNNLRNMK